MFVFETFVRIRYAETDQMGYVYYGNYAAFYEVARTEMLRSLGLTYRDMEAEGIMLPVMEMSSKYLKPALYDDLIKIKVSIVEKPSVKITFLYELFNEANDLINTAETTLVFYNKLKNRPCFPPKNFIKSIQSYFE